MKKLSVFIIACLSTLLMAAQSGGIAVNTTGNTADSSAILDVDSDSKGVLIPRMTENQRNSIHSPKNGLIIYNIDAGCINYYYNMQWCELCGTNSQTATNPTIGSPIIYSAAINNSGNQGDNSSILDISSNEKGLLIPRMTENQRNLIINPANGLLIFNIETGCIDIYKIDAWVPLCGICNFYTATQTLSATSGTFIGNITNTADSSAILEIQSDNKGVLIPRMSETERDLIISPTNGLLLFNITTNCINYFNNNNWLEICGICSPQPEQANAGNDQIVIGADTLILNGNSAGAGIGLWSVISGNGGTFSDINNPNSTFYGTGGEVYELEWSISTACGNTADTVAISFARRVFVTSTGYTGALGGLSGADAKCQSRADSQNLGGTWKAWLSSSSVSAGSRLNHSNAPYVLLNGTMIAYDWNDLTNGTLLHKINLTETGSTTSYVAWTNTSANGSSLYATNSYSCNSWTSSSSASSYHGNCGSCAATNSSWSNDGTKYMCSASRYLYCFEQ